MGLRQRTIGSEALVGRASRVALSRLLLSAIWFSGLSASVSAQEAAPDQPGNVDATGRAWSIVPSITLQETFTDNASLNGATRSDWITDVAPGIRVVGRTKRLNMHLDYGVHELLYAQGSGSNQTQQSLNAQGTLEAVDRLLFVDMSGVITQQRISAFGAQSASSYSVNANSTEMSSFRISPYVIGRFGGYVDYEGRYARTSVRAKSSGSLNSDSEFWSGKLSGDTPLAALGWSADADRQNYDYAIGRGTESERWRGSVNYRVTTELKLSASAGQERNNFATVGIASYDTHGFGVDWRPTERTNVSAFKEKRFFGDGHTVVLSHRMSQSLVKYSDSRDISVSPTQSGAVVLGTVFDFLMAQNAAMIPDVGARTAYVNLLLTSGPYAAIPGGGNALITAGFMSSQATVQRRQELSYILNGARNVMTLGLVRSHDDRLGAGSIGGVDFSNTSSISQQGVNVGWAHQLSGISSLNVTGSQSRSTSGTDANLQTTQKALSASISTRLGAKTRGSITARRTVFDSTTTPYTENAVSGMVAVEF